MHLSGSLTTGTGAGPWSLASWMKNCSRIHAHSRQCSWKRSDSSGKFPSLKMLAFQCQLKFHHSMNAAICGSLAVPAGSAGSSSLGAVVKAFLLLLPPLASEIRLAGGMRLGLRRPSPGREVGGDGMWRGNDLFWIYQLVFVPNLNLPSVFCAGCQVHRWVLCRMSSSWVGFVPDVKFMGGFCAGCQVHQWVLCRMSSSSVGVAPDVKFISGFCAGWCWN